MTKFQVLKYVTTAVSAFTVGATVNAAVKNAVPVTKTKDQIIVEIAAFILSAMAAKKAADWTAAEMDELIASWTHQNQVSSV